MKLLIFIFAVSNVFAIGPDMPLVGRDKKGNPIVTENGHCFKVVDSEHLIHVPCKKPVRKK